MPRPRPLRVLFPSAGFLVLAALLAVLRPCPAEFAWAEHAVATDRVRCVTALDGDSLLAVWPDGKRFQIRLLGVDCPEKGQEFADAARDASRDFCAGQEVELEYGPRRTDRYGRVLAYVRREGKLLNEELVLRGLALAVCYDPGEALADRLARGEERARAARAGFWARGGLRMSPRSYRRAHPHR